MACDLKGFCDHHGLNQLVRESLRNEFLLDLVISNDTKASALILHVIADRREAFTTATPRENYEF